MQGWAPGYAAAETREDLHERGIYPISGLPFSHDLNPMRAVWNQMKKITL
jgi:hypothetical protein